MHRERVVKISLGPDITYFDGEAYELVLNSPAYVRSEPELAAKFREFINKDKYFYVGKHARFLGSRDEDYGYKIFNGAGWGPTREGPSTTDPKMMRGEVEKIFDIHKLLSEAGYAPKPYEIIECYDGDRLYFAIKMDNIKGHHIRPRAAWINNLAYFCQKNNLSRAVQNIGQECNIKNCIKTDDGKIYMVDIDPRWVQ